MGDIFYPPPKASPSKGPRGEGWHAPVELAGALKVKVSHDPQEIADMEDFAESIGWAVMPHKNCPECEKIKRKRK